MKKYYYINYRLYEDINNDINFILANPKNFNCRNELNKRFKTRFVHAYAAAIMFTNFNYRSTIDTFFFNYEKFRSKLRNNRDNGLKDILMIFKSMERIEPQSKISIETCTWNLNGKELTPKYRSFDWLGLEEDEVPKDYKKEWVNAKGQRKIQTVVMHTFNPIGTHTKYKLDGEDQIVLKADYFKDLEHFSDSWNLIQKKVNELIKTSKYHIEKKKDFISLCTDLFLKKDYDKMYEMMKKYEVSTDEIVNEIKRRNKIQEKIKIIPINETYNIKDEEYTLEDFKIDEDQLIGNEWSITEMAKKENEELDNLVKELT